MKKKKIPLKVLYTTEVLTGFTLSGWGRGKTTLAIPTDSIPKKLHKYLKPDADFWAKINPKAVKMKDLDFSDWEVST